MTYHHKDPNVKETYHITESRYKNYGGEHAFIITFESPGAIRTWLGGLDEVHKVQSKCDVSDNDRFVMWLKDRRRLFNPEAFDDMLPPVEDLS